MKIRKYNRIQKTKPKYDGGFWCPKCDCQVVHIGQKCSVCGLKTKTKHKKK